MLAVEDGRQTSGNFKLPLGEEREESKGKAPG